MLNIENRTLFTCDNLDIMRGINSETIDLIYLDPPFNSNRNYAAPIGSQAAGAAFKDTWSLDDIKKEWAEELEASDKAIWAAITMAGYIGGESIQAYLTYMAIRLIEIRRILKKTGSIWLHCDPTASHYLKVLMDAVFGERSFKNEIVWHYRRWTAASKRFQRMHDILFYYTKSDRYVFTNPLQAYADEKYIEDTVRGIVDGKTVRLKDEKGNYIKRKTQKGGVLMHDVWEDINFIAPTSKERTGYPTQKPLALLERIIEASSNEGDVVLDPFCGCATTCIAAEKLGRQWIGIDIEPKARDIVIERLKKEVDNWGLIKAAGGNRAEVIHHKNAPKRTEEDAPRRSRNIKEILYWKQGGKCAAPCGKDGTGRELDIDLFEVDHIRPKSKGGPDIDENLQLLCPTCNRRKGNKTMQYLLDVLTR